MQFEDYGIMYQQISSTCKLGEKLIQITKKVFFFLNNVVVISGKTSCFEIILSFKINVLVINVLYIIYKYLPVKMEVAKFK